MKTNQDGKWMQRALALAEQAKHQGEVPVGAVLVHQNEMIAEGFNRPITTKDPSAHAEIVVMRAAAARIENYRLLNTSLYVTLEPCLMCAGAMVHARIHRLIFGAADKRAGAVTSQVSALDLPFLNHRVTHTGGVLATECAAILTAFFRSRR